MKRFFAAFLAAVMFAPAALAAEDVEITVNGEPISATGSEEQTPAATELPAPEATAAAAETAGPEKTAAPAPIPTPEATKSPYTSNKIVIHAVMDRMIYTEDSFAKLELYSMSGELLDFDALWVGGVTTDLTYTFDVPEYAAGESFVVKVADGLSRLRFYDDYYGVGDNFTVTTYTYTGDDGSVIIGDSFEMTATPIFRKSVTLRYDGVEVPLSPGARVIEGVTMVPIRQLAEYIGLSARYDASYNVEVISLGGSDMYFNLDTAYTTVFGTDLYAPFKTVWLDGEVFAALRTFSDALGSTLDVTDNYSSLSINMTASQMVNDYFASSPVNKWGVSSRTDYLVWISLNEYKVRVYLGKQYQWEQIREMTCTIGAPGSPTITGSFEYQYSMPRWDYGTYYVGPCLVFYGNYAIHSVFLYQDGSEYDGRVGMQLSHGCVRLKKVDIDWMYSMIPRGTRIYITP